MVSQLIETLRDYFQHEAIRFKIEAVFLYGFQAAGLSRPDSDVDLELGGLDGLLPKSYFMLRQAQHERKSHMISTYPVRPEPVEGQAVALGNSPLILDTVVPPG